MMKADVAKYSFHGIGIAVSGAESVRTAIHSRLESFSAEELENLVAVRFRISISERIRRTCRRAAFGERPVGG